MSLATGMPVHLATMEEMSSSVTESLTSVYSRPSAARFSASAILRSSSGIS